MPPVLLAWWIDFKIGVIFLTRLPLREARSIAPGELARATRAMPLVGVVVAVIGGLVFALASALDLPAPLAALLTLAATILVTGALHEDGLADLADGFGGGTTPARKLEIMRDSRIGSYGALALLLSVSLRAAALAAIAQPGAVMNALIAAHSLSRAMIPTVMRTTPLARDDGLAAEAERPSGGVVRAALIVGVVVAALALGPLVGVLALLVGLVVAFALAELARRQVGGYSGDVLGAVQQAAEIALLLLVVALAPGGGDGS